MHLEAYPLDIPASKPTLNSFDECISATKAVIERFMPEESERMAFNQSTALQSYSAGTDIELLRSIKQKDHESVHDYTNRFYDALHECFPNLDSRITEQPDNDKEKPFTEADAFIRRELYKIYMHGLSSIIVDHIPIPSPNRQCLKNISEQAAVVEDALKTKAKAGKSRHFHPVIVQEISMGKTAEKPKTNRSDTIGLNCDKRGHWANECGETPVQYMTCGKKKHLAKYCYRNKDNKGNRKIKPTGRKFPIASKITKVLIIVSCLIAIILCLKSFAQKVKWCKPKFMGDFIIETVYPACTDYYIPMLWNGGQLYSVKRDPPLIISATKDNFKECPCKQFGKGFVSGEKTCYSFLTISVDDRSYELQFAHPDIDKIVAQSNSIEMGWALTGQLIQNKNRRPTRPDIVSIFNDMTIAMTNTVKNKYEIKEIHILLERVISKTKEMKNKQNKNLLNIKREDERISESQRENTPVNLIPIISAEPTSPTNTIEQDIDESSVSNTDVHQETIIHENNDMAILENQSESETQESSPKGYLSDLNEFFTPIQSGRKPVSKEHSPSPKETVSTKTIPNTKEKEKKLMDNIKTLVNITDNSKNFDISLLTSVITKLVKDAEGIDGSTVALCLALALVAVKAPYGKIRILITKLGKLVKRDNQNRLVIRDEASREALTYDSEQQPRLIATSRTTDILNSSSKTSPKTKTKEQPIEKGAKDNAIEAQRKREDEIIMQTLKTRQVVLAITNSTPISQPLVNVRINRSIQTVLLDDGSGVSIINKEKWHQIGNPVKRPTQTIIENTHHEIKLLGECVVNIQLKDGRHCTETMYIAKGMVFPIILGRTFLSKFGTFTHDYRKCEIRLGKYSIPIENENSKVMELMKMSNYKIPQEAPKIIDAKAIRRPIIYNIKPLQNNESTKNKNYDPITIEKHALQTVAEIIKINVNKRRNKGKISKKQRSAGLNKTIFNTPQQRILTQSSFFTETTIQQNEQPRSVVFLKKFKEKEPILGPILFSNETIRKHYDGIIFYFNDLIPSRSWEATIHNATGIGITIPCRVGGYEIPAFKIFEIMDQMKNVSTLRLEITKSSNNELVQLVKKLINIKVWQSLSILVDYTWKHLTEIFPLHRELHISFVQFKETKTTSIIVPDKIPKRDIIY
uniref:RVP domain-containing protein n=1 Tax=Strongyloides stercoralis TaxID=6248 RepID=A0AAF5DMZ5_STRER